MVWPVVQTRHTPDDLHTLHLHDGKPAVASETSISPASVITLLLWVAVILGGRTCVTRGRTLSQGAHGHLRSLTCGKHRCHGMKSFRKGDANRTFQPSLNGHDPSLQDSCSSLGWSEEHMKSRDIHEHTRRRRRPHVCVEDRCDVSGQTYMPLHAEEAPWALFMTGVARSYESEGCNNPTLFRSCLGRSDGDCTLCNQPVARSHGVGLMSPLMEPLEDKFEVLQDPKSDMNDGCLMLCQGDAKVSSHEFCRVFVLSGRSLGCEKSPLQSWVRCVSLIQNAARVVIELSFVNAKKSEPRRCFRGICQPPGEKSWNVMIRCPSPSMPHLLLQLKQWYTRGGQRPVSCDAQKQGSSSSCYLR